MKRRHKSQRKGSSRERVSVPLRALRAAVRKAIAANLRAGVPVYFWENGRIVKVSPKRKKRA